MIRAVRHTILALLLGSLLVSCSGRPRIIPRATLVDIYADMFLADQWLTDHPSERNKADTTLFYDPIFARYGYTFEDYDATVKRYIKDPEKFSKLFKEASNKLDVKSKRLDLKVKEINEIREYNKLFTRYVSRDFDSDTVLWSPPSTDTLVLDSLQLDSIRRDSLFRDSIVRVTFVTDSLQRDSVRRDSLRRLFKHRDSLFRRNPGQMKIERINNKEL